MKKFVAEWGEALLHSLIILTFLYFFCWPMGIRGDSMEPSLQEGDHVLISQVAAIAGWYQRGDIIIAKVEESGKEIMVIKRVIGLEGERVQIKNHKVLIDGKLAMEPYVNGFAEEEIDVIVPEGCIFIMGDNRPSSTDSRVFGAISQKSVRGKLLIKFLPLPIQFF